VKFKKGDRVALDSAWATANALHGGLSWGTVVRADKHGYYIAIDGAPNENRKDRAFYYPDTWDIDYVPIVERLAELGAA